MDELWCSSDSEEFEKKSELLIASKDTKCCADRLLTQGLREGSLIGQEANLQRGFDSGFNRVAVDEQLVSLASTRGFLVALQTLQPHVRWF